MRYRIHLCLRPHPTPDRLVLPPADSAPSLLHQDPGLGPLGDHDNNRLEEGGQGGGAVIR